MPKYHKLYSQRGKDSILKIAECRPTFFVKRHSAIIVGLPKALLGYSVYLYRIVHFQHSFAYGLVGRVQEYAILLCSYLLLDILLCLGRLCLAGAPYQFVEPRSIGRWAPSYRKAKTKTLPPFSSPLNEE